MLDEKQNSSNGDGMVDLVGQLIKNYDKTLGTCKTYTAFKTINEPYRKLTVIDFNPECNVLFFTQKQVLIMSFILSLNKNLIFKTRHIMNMYLLFV